MKKRKYSLSIHITSLFLFLAILLGVGLISISFYQSKALLSQIAQELSKEKAHELESAFEKQISPVLTTLDLMATSTLPPVPDSHDKEHNWLKSFKLIFDRNPKLVALFYGSDNGSSTQFRPLRSQQIREQFAATNDAAIMLNYTDMDGKNDFLFYSEELKQTLTNLSRDNKYDPRVRPWYTNAKPDGEIALTSPYHFYYLKTMGVTLSRTTVDNSSVVAADMTLDTLSQQLHSIALSPNTKLALYDSRFNLIASHRLDQPVKENGDKDSEAPTDTIFSTVAGRVSSNTLYDQIEYQGKDWAITLTPVNLTKHIRLYLAEAIPEDDLIADLVDMRNKQILVATLILLLSFGAVWVTARRLANPLRTLINLTENIRGFHFRKTRYPKSVITEVNELTHSIELMEHTLHDLLGLLRDTASNHDFEHLAKTITKQSYLITKAETIVLSILDKNEGKFVTAVNHSIIPFKIGINQLIDSTPWMRSKLNKGDIIHITKHDNVIKSYADVFYNTEIYLFPMLNRHKTLVGILTVGYERPCEELQKDKHVFLRELLNFAEIAKENIDQIQQQKQMMTSFIELMASAIDTKSPYTGGHCQRVPEVARRLTEVADRDTHYFPEFSMDEDKWEELDFAAWLHDCGKVTTPEYIVDKATKLETIYDRIHEIRMRFELLKAQKETDCWKQINSGGDKAQLLAELDTELKTLDEEFEFISRINLGKEEMTEECMTKLQQIASKTWVRTLDDQLGISWVEKKRAGESAELPVTEPLIADKEVHKVHWEDEQELKGSNKEEYVLQPNKLKYNRGELYNLSIRQGTLTDEERYVINNHIIQTIELLKCLPYPEHLHGVPDIAGNHHERIDGKGYPRGLSASELSVQARVMAIADIFEAITSSDRPYKKAYTLDKALDIMTHLATSGHLDSKLYLLFLENNIDSIYASKYLNQAEIDNKIRMQHIEKVRNYIGINDEA
ncbi:metal-dependent phosphohydrolase [Vibrio sp. JC009]|uniref:HD domain-containing phosphohydrolase n=1 Tax=Vibrio sp. JC009 TaxID=2912314 RepID=UPI0023AF18DC|nr:HD domain-containing phosphohydrolase [Vibrio sp. JC009]WED24181.1 metal-dependent phosphohydrolase [Vibrio sp. JC009]